MPSSVDVVIPTRNTRELTLGCLASVLEAGAGLDLRCIVVDNASTDGSAEAIESRFPQVTLIRNDTNQSFAGSCNQAAAAGRAEFVLFLNSDVIARPGSIRSLVGALEASPAHAAAGGRLVDIGSDDPQVGFAVRGFPTLGRQLALLAGLERHWPANPVSRRQLMLDFDYSRSQDAEQIAGACLLCRRADFEALGGFDEGFYYWFEDVDLLWRLRRRGRTAYVADAVFEHVGGASFAGWKRPAAIVTRHRSLLRYFDKHHSPAEQLGLRAGIAALAAIRAVGWLPFDRARSHAYAEVVRMAMTRPGPAGRGASQPLS
jgi:N-acetylglucosaminyl-diphospho-decaprenol L-rhamnosyltransferase